MIYVSATYDENWVHLQPGRGGGKDGGWWQRADWKLRVWRCCV